MSTKKTRAFIEQFLKVRAFEDEARQSLKEVQAIENAARLIVRGGGVDLLRADTYETSANLLESIAKDAP
jgi:hypothetical protein